MFYDREYGWIVNADPTISMPGLFLLIIMIISAFVIVGYIFVNQEEL